MRLHSLELKRRQHLCRLNGIQELITRQIQYHMRTQFESKPMYSKNCIDEFCQSMSAVHPLKRMKVDGLKSKLNRDILPILPAETRKNLQIFAGNTIGARGHRKFGNI